MIDLTNLPAPNFFYELDYEIELKKLRDEFLKRNPDYQNLLLESDPVNKLLEVYAYQAITFKTEVNEKLKQCMLAYATGSNLDNITANTATTRLENETDESLRYRASIAPEGFTCAGPIGAYEFHALAVSRDVMHAEVYAHTPIQGYVTVVILSYSNNGEASEEIRDAVWNHLSAEEVRPLCDTVHVEKAKFRDISIKVKVTYFAGADKKAVNEHIMQSLEYMSVLNNTERKSKDLFKPREMLTINQIHKLARVAGVQNVEVLEPKLDLTPGFKEVLRISNREIVDGGIYE